MKSNVSLLLEEALLLTEEKKFKGLLLEDLKTLDESLSDEDFDLLYESLQEDEELLVEFLGTIAGLGSKAAKWLSSKSSSIGKKLGNYSAKTAAAKKAKSDKKELAGVIKSTRGEHTNAVKAYGKALKGKDPKAQKAALAALKIARNNSRIARGKSQFTGRAPGKKVSQQRMGDLQKTLAARRKTSIYKRLGEALVEIVVEDLLTEDSGYIDKKPNKKLKKLYPSDDPRSGEGEFSDPFKKKKDTKFKPKNPKPKKGLTEGSKEQREFEKGMKRVGNMDKFRSKKSLKTKRKDKKQDLEYHWKLDYPSDFLKPAKSKQAKEKNYDQY
jgi:hypothetical protein